MEPLFKKLVAVPFALFNIVFGSYLALRLLPVVTTRLLQAGSQTSVSTAKEFGMVALGIILFFVIAGGWVSVIIFCIERYGKVTTIHQIFQLFFGVSALEFYLLAFEGMLSQFLLQHSLLPIEGMVFAGSIILGTIFIFAYTKRCGRSISPL